MNSFQELEQISRKREQKKRHKKLMELLEEILADKYRYHNISKDNLYHNNSTARDLILQGPRQEYISPEDRSEYNYGYMDIDEMQANNPNVW